MTLPLGFTAVGLVTFLLLTLCIATTVNTFAMEAAVLFVPAFLFVYPAVVPAFPSVGLQAAIGLALFVELFGYTSSVLAYYFRDQIHLGLAKSILVVSVPVAVVTRALSYFAPTTVLKLLFGGLLVVLAALMFQSHRKGASVRDPFVGTPFERFLPEPHDRIRTDGGTVDVDESTPHGDDGHVVAFERVDRVVAGFGGAMAGFVAIAIGELSQTLLTIRKRVPLRVSTGTSALVLHGTIVAALVTNLLLLRFAPPAFSGHQFTVPFGFGLVAGVACTAGGQAGAFINSRVPEGVTHRAMMVVYTLVGLFMLVRLVAF
jgi:uncharacterized membrane protein YfcA